KARVNGLWLEALLNLAALRRRWSASTDGRFVASFIRTGSRQSRGRAAGSRHGCRTDNGMEDGALPFRIARTVCPIASTAPARRLYRAEALRSLRDPRHAGVLAIARGARRRDGA